MEALNIPFIEEGKEGGLEVIKGSGRKKNDFYD